jgi:hypothetical protein
LNTVRLLFPKDHHGDSVSAMSPPHILNVIKKMTIAADHL